MLGSREGNGEEKKGLMRAEREVKLHGGADSAKSTLHWRLARSGDMEGLGWRAERRGTSRNPSSSIRNCPTTAAGSIYSPSTAILPRSFQFRAVSLPTTLSNLSQFHLRDCILSRGSLRDGRFDPLYRGTLLDYAYEAKGVSCSRGREVEKTRIIVQAFFFFFEGELPLSSLPVLLNS